MRNHNEKRRNMARSVLPSKWRGGARKVRRQIHHGERIRLREALAEARRVPEPDDIEVARAFVDRSAMEWQLVEQRRLADKTRPLERWAERTVIQTPALQAMPPDDRLDYFRRLLPNNPIGRHAVSHLRWVVGGDARHRHFDYRRSQVATIADLEHAVDRVLTFGAVGELNSVLKILRVRGTLASGGVVTAGPPLLLGVHDRDRFIAELPADVRAAVIELARSL